METEYKILAGIVIMFFAGFGFVAWSLIPKPVPFEQLPVQEQIAVKNISVYQIRDSSASSRSINIGIDPKLQELLNEQQKIADNNTKNYPSMYQQYRDAIK